MATNQPAWRVFSSHGTALFYIAQQPGCTAGDLAAALVVSGRTVWTIIGNLKRADLIRVRKDGSSGCARMETTTATGSTATLASLTPSFPTRPSGHWFPSCTRLTVARPSVATRSWREAADAPKTVARIPSWRYNDSLILAANRTLSVEESMPLDFIIVRGAREMTAGARAGCGTVGLCA